MFRILMLSAAVVAACAPTSPSKPKCFAWAGSFVQMRGQAYVDVQYGPPNFGERFNDLRQNVVIFRLKKSPVDICFYEEGTGIRKTEAIREVQVISTNNPIILPKSFFKETLNGRLTRKDSPHHVRSFVLDVTS